MGDYGSHYAKAEHPRNLGFRGSRTRNSGGCSLVRKLYTFGVAVCLFLGSLSGFSQGKGYSFDKKQKKNYAAYPSPYDFRQGGWLFDAGMTGTFGVYPSPISTTDTVISLPSQLRPGISLAVGRYFNFKGKKEKIKKGNPMNESNNKKRYIMKLLNYNIIELHYKGQVYLKS